MCAIFFQFGERARSAPWTDDDLDHVADPIAAVVRRVGFVYVEYSSNPFSMCQIVQIVRIHPGT